MFKPSKTVLIRVIEEKKMIFRTHKESKYVAVVHVYPKTEKVWISIQWGFRPHMNGKNKVSKYGQCLAFWSHNSFIYRFFNICKESNYGARR